MDVISLLLAGAGGLVVGGGVTAWSGAGAGRWRRGASDANGGRRVVGAQEAGLPPDPHDPSAALTARGAGVARSAEGLVGEVGDPHGSPAPSLHPAHPARPGHPSREAHLSRPAHPSHWAPLGFAEDVDQLAVRSNAPRRSMLPSRAVAPASNELGLDGALAADHRLGPMSASSIIAELPVSAVILDSADEVLLASPTAVALGLVRDRDLVHTELCQVARQIRRTGGHKDLELELARGPLGRGVLNVEVRLAALGGGYVLIHAIDRTQAKLVEDTRRDFVANVSHELKTPVGGISLLAEAVLDASDDPEAVSRFARRIQTESKRLTRLVQEIVDLSRLQASQSLSEPVAVPIDAVVREAIDTVSTVANARGITLSVSVPPDLVVYGDAGLLVTATTNLLTNAVNYSPDGTKVAVATRQVGGIVEISVSDQGVGIAKSEQVRIFERFYRVDPARSRATGGTGLGLAIVKHICTNHGGDVQVWSEPGEGSTFTIRLPAARLIDAMVAHPSHEYPADDVGDADDGGDAHAVGDADDTDGPGEGLGGAREGVAVSDGDLTSIPRKDYR